MEIITGYTGVGHVTSAQAGATNTMMYGAVQAILDVDDTFNATIIDDNHIQISSGYGINQGRFFCSEEPEIVSIATGTADKKRVDLIVAKYTKEELSGVENISLSVITGTPGTFYSTPQFVQGNILEGDRLDEMLLYSVYINGIKIEKLMRSVDIIDPVHVKVDSVIDNISQTAERLVSPYITQAEAAVTDAEAQVVAASEQVTAAAAQSELARSYAEEARSFTPSGYEELVDDVSQNASDISTLNSNLTSSDRLKFQFATDGEGNYGFLKADGSFSPFRSKGGRVILPSNPIVSISTADDQFALVWTQPESEVAIDEYNIYISSEQPNSIDEMTFVGNTTNSYYSIANLDAGVTYYVGVQAVSVDGYENGSIWQIKDGYITPIIFMAVGANTNFKTSNDGVTWDYGYGIGPSYTLFGVAYGNNRFVAVGSNGGSYYSLDGKNWSSMSGLNTNYTFRSVTYGKTIFMTVGEYLFTYYSTNGTSWIAFGGLSGSSGRTLYSVACGMNKFVAVGNQGLGFYNTGTNSWSSASGLAGDKIFYGVAYGNNRFIAVGEAGASHYSTNGTSWYALSGLGGSSSHTYYSVAYGMNRFVAVGNYHAYYLPDGLNTTWKQMSGMAFNNSGVAFYSVTYSNNRFIATGSDGLSYYSVNGETWIVMSGLKSGVEYFGVCSNK